MQASTTAQTPRRRNRQRPIASDDAAAAAERRREAILRIVGPTPPPVTPEQLEVVGGILRHTPDPREPNHLGTDDPVLSTRPHRVTTTK